MHDSAVNSALNGSTTGLGKLHVYFVQEGPPGHDNSFVSYYIKAGGISEHGWDNVCVVITPQNFHQAHALAHECGHAIGVLIDEYKKSDKYCDVQTCAELWNCDPYDYLYCENGADYPGNLMYFGYIGKPISYYTLTAGQAAWARKFHYDYPGLWF